MDVDGITEHGTGIAIGKIHELERDALLVRGNAMGDEEEMD